jgi:hypothetical protein
MKERREAGISLNVGQAAQLGAKRATLARLCWGHLGINCRESCVER